MKTNIEFLASLRKPRKRRIKHKYKISFILEIELQHEQQKESFEEALPNDLDHYYKKMTKYYCEYRDDVTISATTVEEIKERIDEQNS